MSKKRAFLGISKRFYTIILLNNEGKIIFKDDYQIDYDTTKSIHAINLHALINCLKQTIVKDELSFYCQDEFLSFEYEEEYKKDGRFSNRTKDLDLWNQVLMLVDNKRIKLTVINKDSPMSAYGYVLARKNIF